MTSDEDRKLLTQSASGDHAAFAVLYERHAEAVARYAWAWCVSRSDVQDVVQETFVTAWNKSASIRIVESSALPWLLVTCRNHARNRLRKNDRRREISLDAAASGFGDEHQQDARDRLRWVMDEIALLDDVDQRICEMCLVDGRSYKEAAASIGESVAFVGKRLQRARARIRDVVFSNE